MISARQSSLYEARARVAKALAHPSRLLLLDLLLQGERCVCELTEALGCDQSTVSRHLSVLRHAGLVTDRKQETRSFYALRVPCLDGFWRCIDAVLAEDARARQEVCRR